MHLRAQSATLSHLIATENKVLTIINIYDTYTLTHQIKSFTTSPYNCRS